MLKIFMLFFIFALSAISQANLYTEVYRNVEPSIVVVLANDSQNAPLHQGTGFFINRAGDIITNFHNIEGANNVNVITTDGHMYSVKDVIEKDILGDLVCLSVDIPSQSILPLMINTTSPLIGDDIFVIGYPEGPGGFAQSMTRGIVSSVRDLDEYGEVIQIDAAVSPGASGSPLVNSKGEAIGVATFGYIKGQRQNFAVSCKRVSILISKASSVQNRISVSQWNLTRAEENFMVGLDLFRKGEYNQSIIYLDRAIDLNPQYTEALVTEAGALGSLGRWDEALQAANRAIGLDLNNSMAWKNKAAALKI